MVTTYNMKDMVSFGNYVLSDERRELYANHPQADSMPPLEERLKHVSHADVENWKDKKSKEIAIFVQVRLSDRTPTVENGKPVIKLWGENKVLKKGQTEFEVKAELDLVLSLGYTNYGHRALDGTVGVSIIGYRYE